MKTTKISLKKWSLLAVFVTALFTISCEKEDIEIEETQATEEKVKPVVEPITYKYSYEYQGQVYNEKQWDNKYEAMNNPSLSMIGLNDIIYVFDNSHEAQQFEAQELQGKIDLAFINDNSFTSKDATIGDANVTFKIELFDLTNYSGSNKYTHYTTQNVRRKRTWWGWIYLENNEFEADLPSAMRKKTSSYRVTLVKGGSVHTLSNATGSITGNPIYLSMRFHLRAGLLSDGGRVSWSKTLYDQPDIQNRKVEEDSDFSDNTMYSAFGLTTWDNQIQSWQVEFR